MTHLTEVRNGRVTELYEGRSWKQPMTPVFIPEAAPVEAGDLDAFLVDLGEHFSGKNITLPSDAGYLARLLADNFDIRVKRH